VLKTGRISRGYLGVLMQELTPEIARQLGLPDARGAVVLGVLPDSPAARAGLRERDVIRTFQGRVVTDIYLLRELLAQTDLNTKVELGIVREGREMKVVAEIAEAPPPPK
jgi:serine protease Do